ncbi:pilus assembly protein [soil metagenome]
MTADGGGMSTELVIVTPALVVLLLFVVLAGRLGQATQDVTQAAAEAARAASLVRGAEATAVARTTAQENLTAAGIRCRQLAVTADAADQRPGGAVRVDVRCDLELTGVATLGLTPRRSVSASAVEVIDTYRGGDTDAG